MSIKIFSVMGNMLKEVLGESLRGANLSWANLSRANLIEADLSRANLSGANLIEANLSGANLSRANLIEANLSGANLIGANLSGANLSWANLIGANLIGANLRGANLRGADLRGARYSVFSILSINWGCLSNFLTLELMRHDAESCGIKKMSLWVKGGCCPFNLLYRDFSFCEDRKLWKPGKPHYRGIALLKVLAKEKKIKL